MKGGFDEFAKAIRERESSNRYDIENKFGFLGAYQFGKARLLDLGISIDNYGMNLRPLLYARAMKISKDDFLNNNELQDKIFDRHIEKLKVIIKKRFSRYLNKYFKGIYITLSGLVAGAHLVGVGGLSRWFKGENIKDGNNVRVEEYIKKFAGYNI